MGLALGASLATKVLSQRLRDELLHLAILVGAREPHALSERSRDARR